MPPITLPIATLNVNLKSYVPLIIYIAELEVVKNTIIPSAVA